MADIFISYKRENQDAVQRIVQGLRGAGHTVWWDQDIEPDAPWEATIERELEAAKVVIVAWSQAAVASENVKAEARRARNQGKLIQIYVQPCDPPLFFGERQGVDLSNWNGNVDDNRFRTILTAVKAVLEGKRPPEGVGYRPAKRAPWATLTALFVLASAVLGFVSNLGGARDAVCSISAIHQTCLDWGLIVEAEVLPTPEELQEQARQALLQQIVGTWRIQIGQDHDCSDAADTMTFAVTRGEDGHDRIMSSGPDGFQGVSQVTTAADGIITARAASETGRELWEFHPDGDQLVLFDKEGVATTFVRCAR
ncbi:MAG: toll/interleukin-1 receptor domain-containing protein [Hyphomonadaceae bacterium]